VVGTEAKKLFADAQAFLRKMIEGRWVRASGVIGLFPDIAVVPAAPLDLPLERAHQVGDHVRIEGDLSIPAGAVVGGHLVVTGALSIGPGARLSGNIKAHGTVEIGAGAVLEGAVVSRSRVMTGLRARVAGPIVAEVEVSIGPGSVVGDQQRPTSLASPKVILGAGVTVHGLITATAGGSTAEPPT
jgi:cytoskeletal protein CcmA (bactofilin family)